MSTKPHRVSLMSSVKAAAQEADKLPADSPYEAMALEDRTTTSIHMPKKLLHQLRDAANARAAWNGKGRPSVSAIVVDLLMRHLDEIEAEHKR